MILPRGNVEANPLNLSEYELYLIDEGYVTREWAEKRAILWDKINYIFENANFIYKWEFYDEKGDYIAYLPDVLSDVEELTHYYYDFLVDTVWCIIDESDNYDDMLDGIKNMLFSALELDLC